MVRDGRDGCTLKTMSRVTKGMFAVRLFLIGVLAASLSGQIQFPGGGSGSPYPGGPRNPYPGGNGSPMPGGRGRGKTNDPADKNRKKDALPIVTTTGILRAVAGSQFVIEADDHRIIAYKSGDKMTVTKDGKSAELSSFATADQLTVDANSDDQGYFTATAVTFNKAGTDRERQEAARTWDLPELGARSAKPAAKRGTMTTNVPRCAARTIVHRRNQRHRPLRNPHPLPPKPMRIARLL